jgi:phosphoenolpyruvate-protein kinase (PTS system EI component)
MTPLLVGMGVNELSVGAARVGVVRSWVRGLSYLDALRLSRRALAAGSAGEISALVDPVAAALELLECGDATGERLNGNGRVVAFGAQL